MLISIIILFISLIIDGILTNFLPYGVGNLSLFTPLTTIVAITIIYIFFYHKEKEYLITLFVTGIVYDLFYTNLLFLSGLLFLLIGYFIIKMYKITGFNYLWIFIYTILSIIIYECSFALIIILFNLVPMNFNRLIYKISHSLILNIVYGELLYLIINLIPKKYKRKKIN